MVKNGKLRVCVSATETVKSDHSKLDRNSKAFFSAFITNLEEMLHHKCMNDSIVNFIKKKKKIIQFWKTFQNFKTNRDNVIDYLFYQIPQRKIYIENYELSKNTYLAIE